MPKLARSQVYFVILSYFLPKLGWSSSARTKEHKNNFAHFFICTFFVDSFSNFYTFHVAWVHTASIARFSTNPCLIKLLGVGVQTSNSYLHK